MRRPPASSTSVPVKSVCSSRSWLTSLFCQASKVIAQPPTPQAYKMSPGHVERVLESQKKDNLLCSYQAAPANVIFNARTRRQSVIDDTARALQAESVRASARASKIGQASRTAGTPCPGGTGPRSLGSRATASKLSRRPLPLFEVLKQAGEENSNE